LEDESAQKPLFKKIAWSTPIEKAASTCNVSTPTTARAEMPEKVRAKDRDFSSSLPNRRNWEKNSLMPCSRFEARILELSPKFGEMAANNCKIF
jgi:hypothetical protein